MMTRYCVGVIEAAWLTAVVTVPLFTNIFGERIQNEKNFVLQSLALVVLTAWLLKLVAGPGRRSPRFRSVTAFFKIPLVKPAAILALGWIASTILSLSWWDSVFGTAHRREGTFTALSGMLFFAAILCHGRSPRQIDRLITTMILASIPVCLYGIGQRFSIAPDPWASSFEFRVGSTFGNPSFLAAYLAMVLPITCSRVLGHAVLWRSPRRNAEHNRLQAVVYALVALVQLASLFMTVTRAGIIACSVAMTLLFFLAAVEMGKHQMLIRAVAACVLIFIFAFLALRPEGPFRKLAKRPDFQRFTELLDPKTGSSGRFAIWQLAAETARFSQSIPISETNVDKFARIRPFVGYGPEHIQTACRLNRSVEYNLANGEFPFFDRVHNDVWDTLISLGIFGLTAYLAFSLFVLSYGCQLLKYIQSGSQFGVFLGAIVVSTIAGVWACVRWQGAGFIGLGLRFGTLTGLFLFLIFAARRFKSASQAKENISPLIFNIIGLFSGIVAHMTEISFSFPVQSTTLYFWTFVALMVASGIPIHSSAANGTYQCRDDSSSSLFTVPLQNKPSQFSKASDFRRILVSAQRLIHFRRTEFVGGLILALVLGNIGLILLLLEARGTLSPLRVVFQSLTYLPGETRSIAWGVLISVLGTIILFATAWALAFKPVANRSDWFYRAAIVAFVAFVAAAIYWLTLANYTSGLIVSSQATLQNLHRYLDGFAGTTVLHYAFGTFAVLIMGALLADTEYARASIKSQLSRGRLILAVSVGTIGALTIYSTTLRSSLAGVIMNRAEAFRTKARWPLMAAAAEAAIQARPRADNHHAALADALVEQAVSLTNRNDRKAMFLRADSALEIGHRLRPFTSYFLNRRGQLYFRWSQVESEKDLKLALAETAIRSYQRASRFDPGNFDLWYRIALVELLVLQSPTRAHQSISRAIEMFPNSHKAHCLRADVFNKQALNFPEVNEGRRSLLQSAAESYGKALDLASPGSDFSYRYALAAGKVHLKLGNTVEAIPHFHKAVSIAPTEERWSHHQTLGRLYAQAHDRTNSIFQFHRALEVAPPSGRNEILKAQAEALKDFPQHSLPHQSE